MPSHTADKRRIAAAERAKRQKTVSRMKKLMKSGRSGFLQGLTLGMVSGAAVSKAEIKALKDRMPQIGKEAPELKPNRVRPSK